MINSAYPYKNIDLRICDTFFFVLKQVIVENQRNFLQIIDEAKRFVLNRAMGLVFFNF